MDRREFVRTLGASVVILASGCAGNPTMSSKDSDISFRDVESVEDFARATDLEGDISDQGRFDAGKFLLIKAGLDNLAEAWRED